VDLFVSLCFGFAICTKQVVECRLATSAGSIARTSTGAFQMALFDEEPTTKRRTHEIGQDLSMLSVDELKLRIAILNDEISRVEDELARKDTTRSAAEALFRRS
jgi:uncharacterized small protein (DUF1192 family)